MPRERRAAASSLRGGGPRGWQAVARPHSGPGLAGGGPGTPEGILSLSWTESRPSRALPPANGGSQGPYPYGMVLGREVCPNCPAPQFREQTGPAFGDYVSGLGGVF